MEGLGEDEREECGGGWERMRGRVWRGLGEGWDGNRSRERRLLVSNIPQDLPRLKQCCILQSKIYSRAVIQKSISHTSSSHVCIYTVFKETISAFSC